MKMFGTINFLFPFLIGFQFMGLIDSVSRSRPLWNIAMYVLLLIFTIGAYVFMFKKEKEINALEVLIQTLEELRDGK
ncbi:hypothetical protein [Weissella tructae]